MRLRALLGERTAAAAMLAAALVALGVVSLFDVRSTEDIVAISARVLRTQRVLTDLEHVFGEMLWAQGIHRAYVITLDRAFEREGLALLPRVQRQADELEAMISGTPAQSARLRRLRADIAAKSRVLRESFELIDRHGYRAREQMRLIYDGTRVMRDLRRVVGDMEEEERGLLAARLELEKAAASNALIEEMIGDVAAAVFLICAVAILMLQIRRRRLAEESLAGRGRELERSNEELEQFAYAASHDLQEPLRKIANYAELLERRYKGRLDGEADRYIGFIVDGARRMRDLIADLLALSRVRVRPLEQAVVEASVALESALGNLDQAIRESGAAVESNSLPRVLADESELVALFQNLIGNAVKFRAKDRRPAVRVSAEKQADGFWLFSVADNGIGIAAEHYDRIFLAFHRLHGRAEYPGTGIGLALCKRIVERHGGRLWVESRVGEGSTFKFTLPGSP